MNKISKIELVYDGYWENKLFIKNDFDEADDLEREVYLRNLRKKAVQKSIGELSLKERTVLLLYDVEGWKQEEIARLCGVNKSTISRTLHRARKKVGQNLVFFI